MIEYKIYEKWIDCGKLNTFHLIITYVGKIFPPISFFCVRVQIDHVPFELVILVVAVAHTTSPRLTIHM